MNAPRPAEGLAGPQKPFQLIRVEAMTTHDAPVQEQHRDIQSMAALQNRIAIDVNNFDWR